ncbi:MAG: VOC family protein [Candidatus Eremiobacteraeota bacterium]|uniref:VOC domain-containing protein n=1 Tax=mine drainage metagenome TaxID=410659 RepID=E6Q355_9ZZZZ|nr:VOC family protein [Candidatus Eremiobacteraeota bacterium]
MPTTADTIHASGIDCVCYLAKDFKRAKAFYTEVLGLRAVQENENWSEFELPDGSAFALGHMPDTWYPGGGTIFAVADIDAALARVRASGVTIYSEINDSPVCRMVWCADTEGNNIALHQRR